MTREIKFRAWDRRHSRMIDGNDIIFVGEPDVATAFTMHYRLNKFFENDMWIFMPFTGLKDKNGRDIYEGDIIYSEADDVEDKVRWNDEFAGFWPFYAGSPEQGGDEMNPGDWEVKGNIYETKRGKE